MKWLAALIVIIFVLWGALALTKPSAQPSQTATTSATIISGVSDSTYTDPRYRFSIRYPSTASSSESVFDGYLPLTQTPLTSFVLPRSMSTGTNLSEAGVYIGATTSAKIVRACEGVVAGSGARAMGTTTINGNDFASFQASDAGAGNLYETTILRTLRGGACIEIVEMLHSGNIGNFEPGTVREFDRSKFQSYLDAMVKTFMFY